MRTPDRGSTAGTASWTDDEPARNLPVGRAKRVNPPLTAIFELRACTQVRAFFLCIPRTGGMRTPDRGSTAGAASWTDDEPARNLPVGRAKRVNPPLTAIVELRACTQVRAFFLYIPRTGGMRTPDRGSTAGTASWTDDEPARNLPVGRAKRVNPPLTAIFELRACTRVRAFFLCIPRTGGMRTPDRGSTAGAASWTDDEPARNLPVQNCREQF
jgi:CO dehydrogenase/acetyl-CoA synthase beta subunit